MDISYTYIAIALAQSEENIGDTFMEFSRTNDETFMPQSSRIGILKVGVVLGVVWECPYRFHESNVLAAWECPYRSIYESSNCSSNLLNLPWISNSTNPSSVPFGKLTSLWNIDEHHHSSCVNQRTQWSFSSSQTVNVYQRVHHMFYHIR